MSEAHATELAEMEAHYLPWVQALETARDQALAERDRLREALERITHIAGNRGDHAIAIARQALIEPTNPTKMVRDWGDCPTPAEHVEPT